jgi:hypothetical protein
MREVVPGQLWIGNARDSRDLAGLISLGISAIVDLAFEELPVPAPRDMISCRFPLLDGPENTPEVLCAAITTTVALIRSGVPLLVACSGGMSRSPAIVAASLAITRNIPPHDALREVSEKSAHDVSPGLWSAILGILRGEKGRALFGHDAGHRT